MWKQLVTPNLSASKPAGWCLAFVQEVYGAPIRHRSAWDAWLAIPNKHTDALPDASVPLFFSHWGTYQGEYANWGHTVAYVPSRGFLSSPARGTGQQWLTSIEQVERTYNAKYVGWAESLNGLQIVQYEQPPNPQPTQKKKTMILVTYEGVTYLVGQGFISISPDQTSTDALTIFYGGNHIIKLPTSFPALCRANGIPHGVPRELRTKDFQYPTWSEAFGFFDAGKAL